MGMDVYGKNAKSEIGGYFRRNVWGWRPLADCILDLAPEEAAGCTYWHSNDGDGLDGEGAIRLADRIDALLTSGVIDLYVEARDKSVKALPRITCHLCDGTGIRSDEVGRQMKQPEMLINAADPIRADASHPRFGQTGWCNGCNGCGTKPDSATFYGLEANDLREFAAFCRDSGGFEIC